ncbi:MAG: V-type ATP synthase subunit I [Endozoicomonas sp. (ex Botrylloides leachii)]|nr:V-type ATP synthase subunit I [Endozoicomonas sp. (ex Botrylloides leachii)]
MAIKQLEKITLYGPREEKAPILKGLQELGCMHLIPLVKKSSNASLRTQPAEVSETLAWLERSPRKRRQVSNKNSVVIDNIIKDVLGNKTATRKLSDKRDKLEERIREVRPWGYFAFPDLSELNGNRLWFYVIPNAEMNSLDKLQLPWETIHQNLKDSYVIVISEQEPDENLLPVPRSHIGQYSLAQLEAMLEESEQRLEDLTAERESLTRWRYLLEQSLAARQDNAALEQACTTTQDEDEFFLVQGWVPITEKAAVESFTVQHSAAVLFEKPSEDDNPPTILDNPNSTGGGADAMTFFQMPSYRSWDPGNAVFYSFALFFAMIMSDVMYSSIFGLILLLFRKKLTATQSGKRLMNMGLFMSGLGIIWGVLIGSYFGIAPSPNSLLGSVAVLNLDDYDSMMRLSVMIGVAHLVIANLATAWVNRSKLYALAPIGWAVLLVGGLCLWLGKIGTLAQVWKETFGPGLMITGGLLVFLFTSTHPINKASDLLWRMLDGFKAIYNVSAAFGDVLSYLRLFALGLSGASLALTFNGLAADALEAMPVLGVLFAGLILLLGHALNFALCLMSGVIHGMRLNVIEFFNWGLSDEGYPFKAFSKKED